MSAGFRSLVLPVAAAIFAAATCVSSPASARPLQMNDLRALVGVSSPAIAPDGKRAVVVVTRISWNDDKYVRELDLIDLATHARRTLTYDRRGLADPAWSPDGTKLAFLADSGTGEAAKTQVFVMPMDGGDARPVTKAPEGVDQFAWRPDGGALAYAATDAEPKRTGADRFRDAFVVGNTPITTRKPPRPEHLFVVASSGEGKPKQLTFGARSVAAGEAQSTLSWSADGTAIAFTLAPDAVLDDAVRAHVDLVDVASGKLSQLTAHAGYEADPHFSPDGKHVAYTHSAGDNQITLTEAYVTAPGGGEGSALSHPYDRAVHAIAWQPDSRALLFTCADRTSLALVRAPLDGGAPARIDLGELESHLAARQRDRARRLAGVRRHLHQVAGRAVLPPRGGRPAGEADRLQRARRRARPGRLGNGDVPDVAGPAGRRSAAHAAGLHGEPQVPAGAADPRRPDRLVVALVRPARAAHGGARLAGAPAELPRQRQPRATPTSTRVQYDPDEGPGKDVMAALDAVRARGIVDERRIGVSGWSYGGIMTAWMISKYHVWRAAVSGASVNDWATDYGTADDPESDKALFHGSPFVGDNAAEYRRISAITYAKDVTTPVLILSDVGDNRDPFATSSMYYRALRDNGKDATFVAWPIDGHFPRDPVRTADVYGHWIDYIAARFR